MARRGAKRGVGVKILVRRAAWSPRHRLLGGGEPDKEQEQTVSGQEKEEVTTIFPLWSKEGKNVGCECWVGQDREKEKTGKGGKKKKGCPCLMAVGGAGGGEGSNGRNNVDPRKVQIARTETVMRLYFAGALNSSCTGEEQPTNRTLLGAQQKDKTKVSMM